MTPQKQLLVVNELLWIIIGVIITTIILFPLFGLIKNSYLVYNATLILISVFYFRYAINAKQVSYLGYNKAIYFFTVFNIAYLVYFVVSLQEFLYEADNYVLTFFLANDISVNSNSISETFSYFKREFLFFGLSFALLTLAFQARLFGLLWKTLKK